MLISLRLCSYLSTTPCVLTLNCQRSHSSILSGDAQGYPCSWGQEFSPEDWKLDNYVIQISHARHLSQYLTRNAGKSNGIEFLLDKFFSRFYLQAMSSENISETFGFVPDVQSAEKLLHKHELTTTTTYVMYYSYGVGKGN